MEVNNAKIHRELDKIYGNINVDYDTKLAHAQWINRRTPKKVISSDEQELLIFLYTLFQYYLEKANELMNSNEIGMREKGIKIITSWLESSFLRHFKTNKIVYACLNGILNFYLGLALFGGEDQSICEIPLHKSIDYFNTWPTIIKIRYINIYQEIYNILGIIYYDKGEIKKGLQNLGKAEQMYKVFNDWNGYNFTSNFSQFMHECCNWTDSNSPGENSRDNKNNITHKNEIAFFNFYIDGGWDKKSFERNYTSTLMFYAQCVTKWGFRKKAIRYCSLALKRNIEFNEYEIKDALDNCINLSGFYMENHLFAQAEYILISGMSLLPDESITINNESENTTHIQDLRASIQSQLGLYFLERLKFAVTQIKEQMFINENDELFSTVNKRIFTFNTLNIIWPKIEDVKDSEQAKILFRLSNTQFKKALEYYLINTHYEEHIQIIKNISELYKYLMAFETDNNRLLAMMERRVNWWEPIKGTIQKESYILEWQQITWELADVYSSIFESNYELIRTQQKKVNVKDIDWINSKGEKGIYYYKEILDFIIDEYNKEEDKNVEDFVTIVNIKINIARLMYKLIYNADKNKKLNAIKDSWTLYQEVKETILQNRLFMNDRDCLKNNLDNCEEMEKWWINKIDALK